MSNALSMDLRIRFKQLMDGGMRAAAAGRALLLSRATAARWGKKVRNGGPLEPQPSGPLKGNGKLEPFLEFFVELIEQDPDITLAELQGAQLAANEVKCSTSGIDGLLRSHGYTYKKKGFIAQERDKPAVREARHDWARRQTVMQKHPDRLVFLDETGTSTNMTRTYGRCPMGQRLKDTVPFRRSGNQTLIAGLSFEGIVAPWVISGAMNREIFETYVEKVLIPELQGLTGPKLRNGPKISTYQEHRLG